MGESHTSLDGHEWPRERPQPCGLCLLVITQPCCNSASLPATRHFLVLLHPTAQAPNTSEGLCSSGPQADQNVSFNALAASKMKVFRDMSS